VTDGDGWIECSLGHRHWGRYGAAGLLVVAPADWSADPPYVLLQHRAVWSHDGDTWGVPGGARARAETAEQAALRETVEETGLDVTRVVVGQAHVADHGGWSYTTILARAPARLPVVPERESVDLRWVRADRVEELPLHGGFAASWPRLRERLS
jgi:8-oxo-dGTP pyrophosphatase MutT (NUDIX family)